MSDVEEPPTKMSRYEDLQYLEEDCLDEGQEEWLSEGVLTDDDYPVADQDKNDTTYTTNQDTMSNSQDDVPDQSNDQSFDQTFDQNDDSTLDEIPDQSVSQTTEKNDQPLNQCSPTYTQPESQMLDQEEIISTLKQESTEQNEKKMADDKTLTIEETLQSMGMERTDLPEDLDAFLIRKTDGQVIVGNKSNQDDKSDVRVKKEIKKEVKSEAMEDDDDEDNDTEYLLSEVKTLKVAKNALIRRSATHRPAQNYNSKQNHEKKVVQRKIAPKAEPEDDDDDTDLSSDEAVTMQKMFELSRMAAKKRQEEIKKKFSTPNDKRSEKVTTKSESNRNSHVTPKSILKTPAKVSEKKPPKSVEIRTPEPFKPANRTGVKPKRSMEEMDEIIDGEEFLEEDEFDLDEEEFEDSDRDEKPSVQSSQRIMRPERMDEECPSDADSHSEDGSLYDELPSSDSEDMDEFTLDIRAERAADYLPLLGSRAKELLLSERRRVTAKVSDLRQSLSALTASARAQAEQLRVAAIALAELDDTLRAA